MTVIPSTEATSFSNKVVIITGAADGIGLVTAQTFANAGARVVLADIDMKKGEEARAALNADDTTLFMPTDVGDSDSVNTMVAHVQQTWGQVDVLVNNAAVALPGSVTDIDDATWQHVLNVNLTGVWRGMRAVLPLMTSQGSGSIVNISSMQGHLGFRGWSAYAAAKGGVEALTRQAAVEYAPHNIRVNAVAPGTIMTPMNERIFKEADDPDALIKTWNSLHALGRFGQPQEVASAILFLASDGASFITGETLKVEGGMAVNGG
jgi:NAD(P)-dependent dehydrogenase (short-subunit alcohol dehydrogenase family)